MQLLLDALVANQAKEGRLIKLHGQTLAKRLAEDGIASLISEVGQDDTVAVREFRCRVYSAPGTLV